MKNMLLELKDFVPINIEKVTEHYLKYYKGIGTKIQSIISSIEAINNDELPDEYRLFLLNHLPVIVFDAILDEIEDIFINSRVMTPDGEGIVKKIEELHDSSNGYTCVLKKPYTFIDVRQGTKDYNFPAYSFGYTYREDQIKLIK